MMEPTYWRRCSSCKKSIGFKTLYWVCNVSTCNRKRTGLVFCSVACWDAHNPMMNHRESWAEERRSPSEPEWRAQNEAVSAPTASSSSTPAPKPIVPASPIVRPTTDDILVVVSKFKDYVRARSGFNTSDRIFEKLSDRLRVLCDHAIARAKSQGRTTVLDRDFL